MATLKVIVVPPEYLPAADRKDGYAVVLGDLVHPGHYLWRGALVEEANRQCIWWAKEYKLKAYPIDTKPHRPPVELRLVKGGLS